MTKAKLAEFRRDKVEPPVVDSCKHGAPISNGYGQMKDKDVVMSDGTDAVALVVWCGRCKKFLRLRVGNGGLEWLEGYFEKRINDRDKAPWSVQLRMPTRAEIALRLARTTRIVKAYETGSLKSSEVA